MLICRWRFVLFQTRKRRCFRYFHVFSASMSSFMGLKSTQNKTCCLAEANLELMDDPLGPNCWSSVRQHQKNLPEMLLETVGSPWTRKEYWNLLESSLWFAGDTRRTLVTATQAIQIYRCQFRTEITLSIWSRSITKLSPEMFIAYQRSSKRTFFSWTFGSKIDSSSLWPD